MAWRVSQRRSGATATTWTRERPQPQHGHMKNGAIERPKGPCDRRGGWHGVAETLGVSNSLKMEGRGGISYIWSLSKLWKWRKPMRVVSPVACWRTSSIHPGSTARFASCHTGRLGIGRAVEAAHHPVEGLQARSYDDHVTRGLVHTLTGLRLTEQQTVYRINERALSAGPDVFVAR